MHAFIDAFAIGEGEEVIHDIVNVVQKYKKSNIQFIREELLLALSQIPGVYVPKFYKTEYFEDGTVTHTLPTTPGVPKVVNKRIVAKLLPPPLKFIVPNIEVIHNRVSVEIMRGCTADVDSARRG
ncbi:MAG: hypothetical protein IPJ46_24720 [Anaerolineales bacterium]|nr:hypothetical protein [Anaerolineales bacterium]